MIGRASGGPLLRTVSGMGVCRAEPWWTRLVGLPRARCCLCAYGVRAAGGPGRRAPGSGPSGCPAGRAFGDAFRQTFVRCVRRADGSSDVRAHSLSGGPAGDDAFHRRLSDPSGAVRVLDPHGFRLKCPAGGAAGDADPQTPARVRVRIRKGVPYADSYAVWEGATVRDLCGDDDAATIMGMTNPYSPPSYVTPYSQPPLIDPSELRPRRRWFVVAGAVAATGVVAGVLVFALGIVALVKGIPDLGQRFGNGEPVTVRMSAGETRTIYGTGNTFDVECFSSRASEGRVTVSRGAYAFSFSSGGPTWHALYEVSVIRPGSYTLVCNGNDSMFAIGDPPNIGRFFGAIFGSILALVGLPGMGVLGGAIIAIVVGVRRNGHRKRLLAERTAWQPQWYYPYGGV